MSIAQNPWYDHTEPHCSSRHDRLGFTVLVPVLGYVYLGPLYAVLFAVEYVSGFFLWLVGPTSSDWHSARRPYTYTMIVFVLLHKFEENRMKFFDAVSARITHDPVPEASLGLIVALVVIPVGAWLIAPILFNRRHDLGRFLLWTLFASMGLTELAHFILPILAREPYGYFPGMAITLLLAPLAWWGMWRMARRDT